MNPNGVRKKEKLGVVQIQPSTQRNKSRREVTIRHTARGRTMERPLSYCDFCGNCRIFQEYPTDRADANWYACAGCARLIDANDWNGLIERSLAAYTEIRPIAESEKAILRRQVEAPVLTFRTFRLMPV